MEIGISEQIFTAVSTFWLGWIGLAIVLKMLKDMILD